MAVIETNIPARLDRLPWAHSYSAFQQTSSRVPDEDIDDEVTAIAGALRDAGERSRDELGRRVNCRHWGPGRYRRALAVAVQRGEIRPAGRGRFAPA